MKPSEMHDRQVRRVRADPIMRRHLSLSVAALLLRPKQLAKTVLDPVYEEAEGTNNGTVRARIKDVLSHVRELHIFSAYSGDKTTFAEMCATHRECIRRLLFESLGIPWEEDNVYPSVEHPPLAIPHATVEWFKEWRADYLQKWPGFLKDCPVRDDAFEELQGSSASVQRVSKSDVAILMNLRPGHKPDYCMTVTRNEAGEVVSTNLVPATNKEITMSAADRLLNAPMLKTEQVTYVDGQPMAKDRETLLTQILEANSTIKALENLPLATRPTWVDAEIERRKANLDAFVKLTETIIK